MALDARAALLLVDSRRVRRRWRWSRVLRFRARARTQGGCRRAKSACNPLSISCFGERDFDVQHRDRHPGRPSSGSGQGVRLGHQDGGQGAAPVVAGHGRRPIRQAAITHHPPFAHEGTREPPAPSRRPPPPGGSRRRRRARAACVTTTCAAAADGASLPETDPHAQALRGPRGLRVPRPRPKPAGRACKACAALPAQPRGARVRLRLGGGARSSPSPVSR